MQSSSVVMLLRPELSEKPSSSLLVQLECQVFEGLLAVNWPVKVDGGNAEGQRGTGPFTFGPEGQFAQFGKVVDGIGSAVQQHVVAFDIGQAGGLAEVPGADIAVGQIAGLAHYRVGGVARSGLSGHAFHAGGRSEHFSGAGLLVVEGIAGVAVVDEAPQVGIVVVRLGALERNVGLVGVVGQVVLAFANPQRVPGGTLGKLPVLNGGGAEGFRGFQVRKQACCQQQAAE